MFSQNICVAGPTATTVAASATSGTPAASTKTVVVGYNGHSFMPNNTAASSGDTVEFEFWPANHSVVRAAFMFPCGGNLPVSLSVHCCEGAAD